MIINKENIFGKDGFIWWIGVVEDRVNDPDKLGRVRVRIMGYHSDDLEALPTEELPWAIVMQPTTSAAVSGKGSSPTNLLEGTWCIGFFLDGKEKQQPIVIGTVGGFSQNVERCGEESTYEQVIYEGLAEIGAGIIGEDIVTDADGNPIAAVQAAGPFAGIDPRFEGAVTEDFDFTTVNDRFLQPTLAFQNPEYPLCSYKDKPDTNKMAIPDLEDDDTAWFKKVENLHTAENGFEPIPVALSDETWEEPEPPFCPEYPYNQVFETEAGHVLEFDNTPGKERINLFHTNGTYIEIDVNGTMVRKVVGNNYELVENNSRLYVKGSHNLTVDGKCRIYVLNDCNIEVKENMNIKVEKNLNIEVGEEFNVSAKTINQTGSTGINVSTGGELNQTSGGSMNLYGRPLHLNTRAGTPATPADMIISEGGDEDDYIVEVCEFEPPEYEEVEPEEFFEGKTVDGIVPVDYEEFNVDYFAEIDIEAIFNPPTEQI